MAEFIIICCCDKTPRPRELIDGRVFWAQFQRNRVHDGKAKAWQFTALKGKVAWLSGSKEYHRVTTQQTSPKRVIGRENPGGWLRARSRRELSGRQALYRRFGVGLSDVAQSWSKFRDWWEFVVRLWGRLRDWWDSAT